MHGSARKDGEHSTAEARQRALLWLRIVGSLALFGFLLGMMLGRLNEPEPRVLQRVDVLPDALQLWFNAEPKVRGEHRHGALVLQIDARGREQQGQVLVAGKAANWRLMRNEHGLLLNLLAARPVRGEWRGAPVDGGWRLNISLREE
ncbi:MAG: hypothetical protein ACOH2I_01015 [Pseudomonas sp.]